MNIHNNIINGLSHLDGDVTLIAITVADDSGHQYTLEPDDLDKLQQAGAFHYHSALSELLALDIHALELPEPLEIMLCDLGHHTVGSLATTPAPQFLNKRGFGRAKLDVLRHALQHVGLDVGLHIDPKFLQLTNGGPLGYITSKGIVLHPQAPDPEPEPVPDEKPVSLGELIATNS